MRDTTKSVIVSFGIFSYNNLIDKLENGLLSHALIYQVNLFLKLRLLYRPLFNPPKVRYQVLGPATLRVGFKLSL